MKKYLLLLLFGVSAIIFVQGTGVLHKAYNSTKWPIAKGVVISSTVTYHRYSGKSGAYYSPDVSYRYTVGSVPYVGDTICFASIATHNKSDMEQIAGRYPLGREVKVYYDPKYPEDSVLEPGVTFNSWTKVLVALIFFMAGLIVMFLPKGKFKKTISVSVKRQ
jgi:hypothetical protein